MSERSERPVRRAKRGASPAPDADGVVVTGGGEDERPAGVPAHGVHRARVPGEDLQQPLVRALPDVDLRVLAAAHDEREVAAPEARAHDVPALPLELTRVAAHGRHRELSLVHLREVPEVDVLVLEVHQEVAVAGREADG